MLVIQSHIITGLENVCYFPSRIDVRSKTIAGRINWDSGDITVITYFAHILAKL
jgi:hypothetical protein